MKYKQLILKYCSLFGVSSVLVFPFALDTTNSISNYITEKETKADTNLSSPISTDNYSETVSNNEGFLGRKDTKSIFFTSYSGFTMWNFSIENNSDVKSMFKTWYPNSTDTDYNALILRSTKLVTYNNQELLFILVNKPDVDSEINNSTADFTNITSRTMGFVFAISAKTGQLFDPVTVGNNVRNYSAISAKVKDGARSMYVNSAGDVIVTSNGPWGDRNKFDNNSNKSGYRIWGYNNATSKINISSNGLSITDRIVTSKLESDDYTLSAIAPGPLGSGVNVGLVTYPVADSDVTYQPKYEKYLYLLDDNMNPIKSGSSYSKVSVGQVNVWVGQNNATNKGPNDMDKKFIPMTVINENKVSYFIANEQTAGSYQITNLEKKNNDWVFSELHWSVNGLINQSSGVSGANYNFRFDSGQTNYSSKSGKIIIVPGITTYMDDGRFTDDQLKSALKNNSYRIGEIDVNKNKFTGYFNNYNEHIGEQSRPWSRNTFSYPIVIEDDDMNTNSTPPLIVTDTKFGQSDKDKTNTTIYAIPNYTKVTSTSPTGENDNQFRLNQFTYKNIQTLLESQSFYKTKLPSKVTDDEVLKLLDFNGQKPTIGYNKEGDFDIKVTANKDDDTGIINAVWTVTYQNFYNTNKKTIQIAADLTGFNSSANKYISFVTKTTGDNDNDNKLQAISKLKQEKYPSEISAQQVIDNFVHYNLIGKDGNIYKLSTNDVKLEPNNGTGELKITIDLNGKLIDGLENTISTNITQTYSGFKILSGYEARAASREETIASSSASGLDILNIYPSQLSKQDIINHFMVLGEGYSKSADDWNVDIQPDNLKGTVTINATYLKDDVPGDKIVLDNHIFDGLRTVVDDFKSVNNTMEKAKSSDIIELYELYKKAYDKYTNSIGTTNEDVARSELLATELLSSLNTNLLFNKWDLIITPVNLDDQLSITFNIEIKENATANIETGISNYPLLWNDTTKTGLENAYLATTWTVTWDSVFKDQKFEWNKPTEVLDENYTVDLTKDTIDIDLNKVSYENINKNMYADQIDEKTILNMFNASYYSIDDIALTIDKANGIVKANLILTSSVSSNPVDEYLEAVSFKSSSTDGIVNEGNQVYKSITISGFKKPISPIYISLAVAIPLLIIVIVAVVLIYLHVINKNLKKLVANQSNYSKLKPSENSADKYKKIQKELMKKSKGGK